MPTPLHIILLEDNEADAELMAHELKNAGMNFEIQRVETKNDFLSALETFHPDAVLADFTLGGFTGLDAYLLMKSKNVMIPFLLVTGTLPETAVTEVIKSGIDDYVLKNNLIRLPTALQNALVKKAAERQSKEYFEETERMNKLMVGRELRMIELKKELEELKKRQRPDS